MDIHDLTGKELIYIKRFEQLGFWRKKFELDKDAKKEDVKINYKMFDKKDE